MALTGPEIVGVIRDLALIFVSLFVIFALALFLALGLLLYRRVSRLISRAEEAIERLNPAIANLAAASEAISNFTKAARSGFGLAGIVRLIGRFVGGSGQSRTPNG